MSRNPFQKDDVTYLKSFITSLFICLAVLVGSVYFYDRLNSDIELWKNNGMAGLIENVKPSFPFLSTKKTFLFLGVDSNGKHTDTFRGTRSDTIILANFDPKTKKLNMISIPRDSKVYIADGHGIRKINSAFALGGPSLAIKTIEDTLGVKIDYYLAIDYAGVKKLVDALGGVEVDVEKNMRYTDRTGNLHVDLTEGYHTLNGDQAEEYIRFRHDKMGDIGRISRQQNFVMALIKKLESPSTVPKIPELIKIASENTQTNMSAYDMSKYGASILSVKPDNINVKMVPGAPSKRGRLSYWIIDAEETQNLLDVFFYSKKPADVLQDDGSGDDEDAENY